MEQATQDLTDDNRHCTGMYSLRNSARYGSTRKAAEVEGVALKQLINVAVAKKVSALRTEEYFRERGRRADRAETLRILERAGQGNPLRKAMTFPRSGGRNQAEKLNERD